MQMYVYKNGQQLGPYEENQVAEMLHGNQLSATDLGFKQGQQQWKNLGEMFPPLTPTQPSPNVHISQARTISTRNNSTGLMFGLIGCGGLIFLCIVAVIFFAVISNKRKAISLSDNSDPADTPIERNSISTATNPTSDYTALKNKAEELARFAPPANLVPSPVIKGKIAIVENKFGYGAEIKGFDHTGKKFFEIDIEGYGFSTFRLATTPDQIETLIQITCNKGKYLGKYTGDISAFARVCKATIIDYKNSVILAQKTFVNSNPPMEIKVRNSSSESEYVLSDPEELDDYLSSLPLEKLPTPLVEQPFNSQNGTYGKYTGFKRLAAELTRIPFAENLTPGAAIKGKIAVVYKSAEGRSELKGFDAFGKEISNYDYEKWGVTPDRIAEKPDEIETLIRIICQKGSRLGVVKRIPVFSNKCEVSIINYSAGTIIAKQSFENKEMENDVDETVFTQRYIVIPPFETEYYIKGFPK